MKVKYLGTAAREGFPAMFCVCDNCKKAWERGGRNIRSRSQVIVDNDLLIDLPGDTFYHAMLHNVDLSKIHHCLVTHIHRDHFDGENLYILGKGHSHPPVDGEGLTIYGSEDFTELLEPLVEQAKGYLRFQCVLPFQPFAVGPYTVTALKAFHRTNNPYLYLVSDGTKTMFYGNDTGMLPEETWGYLEKNKVHLDMVSLDCTMGANEHTTCKVHMHFGQNVECKNRMMEMGIADEHTKFVLTHFSHNGLYGCYDDFCPIALKEGFDVSFDGMEVKVGD